MIALRHPGWSRRAQGDRVHLIAPEGAECGVITLCERVRPLAHLAEVMRGKVAARSVRVISGPTPISNDEGERGVLVTIRGDIDEVEYQRDVGLLAGDEFYASVIGVTREEEHFARTTAAVRSVLERFPLWLGVRRRLYLYPPPRGWRGVARGLEAAWYAPGFPRDPARLTVFPAIPTDGPSARDSLAALTSEAAALLPALGEARWIESTRATPLGLHFECRTASSGGQRVHLAVATAHPYLYALRLETSAEVDHEHVLAATLDGVVPIHHGRPPPAPSALVHWVE
jgi:hypothetical protein